MATYADQETPEHPGCIGISHKSLDHKAIVLSTHKIYIFIAENLVLFSVTRNINELINHTMHNTLNMHHCFISRHQGAFQYIDTKRILSSVKDNRIF